MNVIFISNYLNYHQTQLWDSFVQNKDVGFVFLELEPEYSVIKSQENRSYCIQLKDVERLDIKDYLGTFDIIIIGNCKNKRILSSLPTDKVVFHCSEHYWKKINTPLSLLKRICRMIELRKRYKRLKQLNILATSSRLKRELDKNSVKYANCFKFAYFPPTNKIANNETERKNKKMVFIGRAIYWKRPEYSFFALKEFNKIDFGWTLDVFSEGKYLNNMKFKAKNNPYVNFYPFVSHDEVLKKFQESEVFIFSSNREEGWGAVLNEALSCGTIVFASSDAGATNYLIKDGFNGFTFKTKKELKRKIALYLKMSEQKKQQIRLSAFLTIANEWNEKIASERLLLLFRSLLSNNRIPCYKEGPLSLDK